jgi:hypothetical protein
MAKRNTLRLDTSGFEELIVKLEGLNGDVKSAVTDALMQAAETVHDDTVDALADEYLPRQGDYSTGRTKTTVAEPEVKWSGTIAEAPVGFDYGEKGAGGFLISGTPRMQPNRKLEQIYTRKKYMRALQEDMQEVVTDYIKEKMEG